MTDNETIILLRATLAAILPEPLGYVLRYQPTQEGRTSTPTIYLHPIAHKRYGWRDSKLQWVSALAKFSDKQAQHMESTYQFSCQQPPSTSALALSPHDVLERVAGALQSDRAIARLQPYAQVLRVSDVRVPYYKNDRDVWEQSPNFDIVIKHQIVFEDNVPVITKFDFEAHMVPDLI